MATNRCRRGCLLQGRSPLRRHRYVHVQNLRENFTFFLADFIPALYPLPFNIYRRRRRRFFHDLRTVECREKRCGDDLQNFARR